MNTLKAEKRDMLTKAKKLRREGYVTGNIYGREMKESIPLQITKADAEKILRSEGKGSQVMLELDGKTYDALIKEVDYNPLAHTVEEVDFQALVSNEMVHSTAEIILENEEKVMSGVLQDELKEVAYKALPADLVDKIKVDVAGMKIGDTLRVKDLEIAKNKNIHITTDPEAVVATVTPVHNVVPETETEAEETAEEK